MASQSRQGGIDPLVSTRPLSEEFTQPRLVAAYDAINAYEPDAQPGFYRGSAAEVGARRIVDLGCGTGLITCDLACHGFRMVGVDPSPGMMARARRRAGGERVRWIVGGADRIGTPGADLAIMSGHVPQFFLTDEEWHDALVWLRAGLQPAGRLAFETRNPSAREWESWTRSAGRWVDAGAAGRVETWCDFLHLDRGIVSYDIHYAFAATGDELVVPSRLRFRTEDELQTSLHATGFQIERVYGDWHRGPVTPTSPELIVMAVG